MQREPPGIEYLSYTLTSVCIGVQSMLRALVVLNLRQTMQNGTDDECTA